MKNYKQGIAALLSLFILVLNSSSAVAEDKPATPNPMALKINWLLLQILNAPANFIQH